VRRALKKECAAMGDWWLVICGWGALWVRAGFALHECGMVRSKNSAGALLRKVADLGVTVLAFWAVGQAVLALVGVDVPRPVLAWRELFATPRTAGLFYLMCLTLIATGIPGGVLGERSRFWPMLAISAVMGAIVVPLAIRWTMAGGWLYARGFADFAGAGAVHLIGALFAAVAAVFVGPRVGKYNRDGSSNAIPGHSVPLASIGLAVLLVGWFPYVLGLASQAYAGHIAANVLLAAAAGVVSSLLFSQLRYGKADIHLSYAGLLGALVAVSAAAGLDAAWKVVLIGAVAGVIVPIAVLVIDLLWKIDDPTGGIAVHGVGALWGLLAVGLLRNTATIAERMKLFVWQVLGILAVAALAAVAAVALMLILRTLVPLRSREADEFDGLDLAEHDIGAYPDFQQTMIKSYHLREA
jgi:Amt family ammonium transporter